MKYLAPSILSADFTNLAQQIRFVEMGGADIIHCDIMDGVFVPNISFGSLVVKAVRKVTNLPIDVHLMIKNPDRYVKEFAEAGASYISVHAEEVVHLDRVLNLIKEFGVIAGVVINPSTSVASIENVLGIADFVLVMSVNPGFGGQKFIRYTANKISELKDLRSKKNLKYLIEVDGGIDKNNIKEIADYGCDIFVAGSAIFHSDNITAATLEMKNLIK
jgi:ribulose-phosphate 3-epimerase